ncbi:MAG TPA: hypothetical protein VKG26_08800 [Bacteroidia bacterium]|nr:hypothetical protein [Bacteroidia bacterium]
MKAGYTIWLLAFVFVAQTQMAQTTGSGVYITLADYKSNKLAEDVACKKHSKEIFKKHDVFAKTSFVVINNGKKTVYLKKDLYAYRDCANTVWRFYNNREYEIVETKEIYIYILEKIVLNGIAVEKGPVYYFSNGAGGEIKKLTMANLMAAYPNQQTFYILGTPVKSDEDIKAFDTTHKTDIANYLYSGVIK